ncbi:UPF0545 protein C22orf39 homolog [Erinaceus europaeus]|uniref:UPF0545 protein C22orf39 homolog n=1 Tax=Erinaceus europaeus TaxID=9365 RepID=A0ABM3VYP6_ERIEU|nr:UPF0545 protein C22orf39 homolog [Erinaceus europaeus]
MANIGRWQPLHPCETYHTEQKLCQSARHFLHSYYVHGEWSTRKQWRCDPASCQAWEQHRSAKAQVTKKHNLVWALRQKPP